LLSENHRAKEFLFSVHNQHARCVRYPVAKKAVDLLFQRCRKRRGTQLLLVLRSALLRVDVAAYPFSAQSPPQQNRRDLTAPSRSSFLSTTWQCWGAICCGWC